MDSAPRRHVCVIRLTGNTSTAPILVSNAAAGTASGAPGRTTGSGVMERHPGLAGGVGCAKVPLAAILRTGKRGGVRA